MARRTHIIKYMSDLGFPFGLPQIIAGYADYEDDERTNMMFHPGIWFGRKLEYKNVGTNIRKTESDRMIRMGGDLFYSIGWFHHIPIDEFTHMLSEHKFNLNFLTTLTDFGCEVRDSVCQQVMEYWDSF